MICSISKWSIKSRSLVLLAFLTMLLALPSVPTQAQNSRLIGVGDGVFLYHTDNSRAEKLYAFKSSGHAPEGDFFRDSQGIIWGMTTSTDSDGAIFRLNADGSSVEYVHFFRQPEGSNPRGTLIEANGKLWGTTYQGGASDFGIVFSIDLDGTNFTKVHDFDSDNGAHPGKRLLLSNGRIWGLTYEGGVDDGGVIFNLATDGTDYQVVHEFLYNSGDAGYPEGGLIEVGSTLWGLTSYGGTDDYGAIFSIDNNGSNYQLYHSFEYSATDGANPLGDLVEFDGRLWGLTEEGGANDNGTLFGIQPNGSGYFVHHMFDNADGGDPRGNLVVSDDKLWGTTSAKTGGAGSIFYFDALNPLATSTQPVHTFTGTNGDYPSGSLLDIGGVLWGMTANGGSANKGSIFKIDNNGTNFSSTYSFPIWPTNPVGELLEYDDKLWGVTSGGGDNNYGAIYTMDREGKNMTVVYSFVAPVAGPNGSLPRGGLIQKAGMLYGITDLGGTTNQGTIFKIDPTDYTVTTLHSFTSGGFNFSGLFEHLGNFYGVYGGSSDKVIFKIQPDGMGFQNLITLPGFQSDISLLYNGRLWGTERGSARVFYYDINAAEYNMVKDFTSTFDGSTEPPRLAQYQGRIYGVTHNDGSNSLGSIFSMDSDGNAFQSLHSFDGTEGSFPVGKLVIIDDVIYGATRNGGNNNRGVLYKMNLLGPPNYTVLRNFNQADQNSPNIFNFINPRYEPVFLAQFPDLNLQEDHDPVIFDLTQYVYDVEDNVADLSFNITGTGTGKSFVPVSFALSPAPVLVIYGPNDNFGSSDITVEITDSDNHTITANFTVNVAPVADGFGITNFNQSITYPAISDPITITGLAVDEDDLGASSVTHFRITEITGGQVFLNDGTTEIVNGIMVPLDLGILKFKPSGAGSGSFKVQASVSPDVAGLGGFIVTVNISTAMATPQITWGNPTAITYGDLLSTAQLGATSDVAGTFTYEAFKSGMSITTVSAGTLLPAGVYTLRSTFNPTDANNYYQVVTEVSLTVNKAPLTITADDITRVYGSFATLTMTYEGFVNNEGPAQLPYQPELTYLHSEIDAGTYDIMFVDVPNPANYTISTVDGILTVTKASLTISVADATKVYGNANPTFQLNYTGFVNFDNSDDLDSPPVVSTTAVVNSPVGVYPITVSGAADINYNITYAEGDLTITKKTTDVVGVGASKIYGEANPVLEIQYLGLIDGDTHEDIDVQPMASVFADEFSDAGNYVITLSGGSDNNYNLNLRNDGYLTINKKHLSVGVEDVTTTYGTLPTTYNLTFDGFVNGNGPVDLDVLPEYQFTLPTNPLPNTFFTGLSRVTSGSDNNYILFTENFGKVVVTKAPLEIKAENKSIFYGDPIPALTLAYNGFVNGDNESKVIAPIISTTAVVGDNAGAYPIVLTGGSSDFYELTLTNGTLTINKLVATIEISNLQHLYNGEEIGINVTTDPEGLNVIVTYNGSTSKPIAAGSYEVKATIDEVNYTGEANGTLVIDAITGVEDAREQLNITVYPNPVVDGFSISGVSMAESLYVYTVQGQKVINKSNVQSGEQIDMREFASGTYMIIIDHQGQLVNRRIIKK